MKTLVAVPMKRLSAAKSRLSTGLDCAQRERIALRLFIRGQQFLSTEFPELVRIVVTNCPFVAEAASETRTFTLSDVPAPAVAQRGQAGLNNAAMIALNHARQTGFDWLLLLPGDLACLRADEFRQLLATRAPGCATVVASRDGGTNALLLPVGGLSSSWSFNYGGKSAERHAALLKNEGLRVTCLALPGLAFDVDTLDDYARLRSQWEDNRDVSQNGSAWKARRFHCEEVSHV
ncbi:2-phospho-L-lactate guanylyltransferase [Caballeronia sp. LZ035]|uniref:2-phospho-L-lactate guanylyltransferase n=1 Tax=Caballeronia sp. LZ035 TaxID=3038568 RepID=UPI0028664854|nr:2-phospho-L-lactate guanylyltransferase [Caballeronia sp. LZ035]MDR5761397.1 2-phospho-L-lactate guanylyltransferase [Caballeronia sp. LZ035]